jgi:hypothetical protein
VTIRKAQGLVAGGGEAEQAIGPVVDAENAFFEKSTHGFWRVLWLDQETQSPWGMLKA